MRRVLVAIALVSAMVGAAGCTASPSTPPPYPHGECGGRSILLSLDASTGKVAWRARLSQTSELPLRIDHGNVLVSGPCGAAVVGLDSGDVRFDDTIGSRAIGVLGDHILRRATDETGPVVGYELSTGDANAYYSSNPGFHDATIARRRLILLTGDTLEASDADLDFTGRDWWIQVPAFRSPHLVLAGALVLVVGGDGSVAAVRISDGALRWRTVPPVPASGYALQVTPTPGTVLTAATGWGDRPHSFVYATASADGRLRWTRDALGLVAADRDLTVLRTTRAWEAVGTLDGKVRWTRPAPRIRYLSDVTPALLTPGTVVVQPRYDAVVALDRTTGRPRWHDARPLGLDVSVGRILLSGATFGDSYATAHRGIVATDALTGARLWRRSLDRAAVALAAAPGGTVLVLDGDGVPHAVD